MLSFRKFSEYTNSLLENNPQTLPQGNLEVFLDEGILFSKQYDDGHKTRFSFSYQIAGAHLLSVPEQNIMFDVYDNVLDDIADIRMNDDFMSDPATALEQVNDFGLDILKRLSPTGGRTFLHYFDRDIPEPFKSALHKSPYWQKIKMV